MTKKAVRRKRMNAVLAVVERADNHRQEDEEDTADEDIAIAIEDEFLFLIPLDINVHLVLWRSVRNLYILRIVVLRGYSNDTVLQSRESPLWVREFRVWLARESL